MRKPRVMSRDDWLLARQQLLEEEKQLLRQRDALAAKRRQLPWVRVEQDYEFHTDAGIKTLGDLFDGKSQLIVQHFMFGEDWAEGCPSCSLWADGFNGATIHMEQRDAKFVAISNAPLANINAYKRRMGWEFDWVSSHGCPFNKDYQASFSPTELESGSVYYNFRQTSFPSSEAPGVSIFARDEKGDVFHTYSCYSRGLDNLNVAYQYLDLLPKGRDEEALAYPMAWVKRHDQYKETS